jgi:alkanesulfonate monooxygenase SsuD/methylene tetrahydromethanopterin reductase-like flavin-dependent oxidoreductase (luciferase family)
MWGLPSWAPAPAGSCEWLIGSSFPSASVGRVGAEGKEQEIAFVGTPEQVAEQIDGVRKIPGVTEFSLVANYGGLEHEKVLRTVELFARRVMPALG